MSLDFDLIEMKPVSVCSMNITHNLTKMADAAGIYKYVWRPEENGIEKAEDLIPFLGSGIKKLEEDPEFFKQYNPPNGWGSYNGLVNWLKELLENCKEHPNAKIEVSR